MMLKHLPNMITVFRIVLIYPIWIALRDENWELALLLIFIAGVSDALDGLLARIFDCRTTLGSILDPLADKLLILILFVTLGYKGLVPMWLSMIVVARDMIILVGASVYQWLTQRLQMSPLFSSKVNTTLQILFLLIMMIHLGFYPVSVELLFVFQVLVLISTVYSGLKYVILWSRYTMAQRSNNKLKT